MLLTGRWWKLAYDQIHDDSRTKAQSAKASKSVFSVFVKQSVQSESSVFTKIPVGITQNNTNLRE